MDRSRLLQPLTGSVLIFVFLSSVMLSTQAAGGVALLGIALWLCTLRSSAWKHDRFDIAYVAIMTLLPAIYAFNMLLTGWVVRELDRPAHLVWSIPIYLLIRKSGFHLRAFAFGLLVFATVGFAVGLYEIQALHTDRPQAAFSNAGPYGNYSAVFAAFSLLLVAYRWENPHAMKPKAVAAITLIACLGCTVISGTRSAWVALPILFICGGLVAFDRRMRQNKRLLAVGILSAAALCAALLASPIVQERAALGVREFSAYLADPYDPNARNTSIGIRLLSWEWGFQQFLAHPAFGLGFAQFREVIATAVASGALPEPMRHFNGLHNVLIDHLAKTGWTGTLCLALFWGGLFIGFGKAIASAPARVHRYFACCGLMLIIGELIFSSIGSMFASSLGTLLFVVVLAVCSAGAHPGTPVIE